MSTYQEAVAEAATALKRGEDANWELARLTYENTKNVTSQRPEPGKVTMDLWCADVRTASGRRFGVPLGKDYKRIWRRHGLGDPGSPKLSFAEARDALRPGVLDTDERLEQLHRPQPSQTVRNWTPEQKREVTRALVRDPEVTEDSETVEDVASTPTVRDEAARQRAAEIVRPLTDEQHRRRQEVQEHLNRGAESALSGASLKIQQTLAGWGHLFDNLRSINEGHGTLPDDVYAALVEAVQKGALELRFYAATHDLPAPDFNRAEADAR